ncbi:MAG: PAS domain S-box protein [Bacteroidales bacterium]|nr:PAS domain S-box protein [Bacteroidales bacterium]MCF8455165.1 PAS domain S-box protein [Bacteroidales bacterium]
MDKLNISILYAEDDTLTQRLIASFLKKKFETVYIADNGEQGLQIYKQYRPDLVITDISMPIMSGLDMIAHIREIDKGVNCIITSSNQETNQFVKAIELGVNSFLIKPINPEKLLEQVQRINHNLLLQQEVVKQNALILENEKRYRTLFESAPLGIVIIDQQGNILDYNNKLLRSLNVVDPETRSDLNIYEFIPFINSGITASFMRCMENNTVVERELHYSLKTGNSIDFSVHVAPILIHGDKSLYQAIINDISDRKKYEVALRESEERYRVLFDNAPTGIGIISKDQRYIMANNTLSQMLQFNNGEMKGVSLPGLFIKHELLYEINQNLLFEGKVIGKEVELRKKDNSSLWALLTILPIEIGGQDVYLSAIQDITNIKKSEQSLLRKNNINKAISEVATMLLTSKNITETINHSLAVIGKIRSASRAYLYTLNKENGTLENHHEWCNPHTYQPKEACKALSISKFPWLMDQLRKGEATFLNSASELPAEATGLKRRMETMGVNATVAIPIHLNGQLYGFLGFDHVNADDSWSLDEIPLLKTASMILSTAMIKNQQDLLARVNEERLNMAITSSNDGLWDWNITTGETYFSPRWMAMLGFDEKDLSPLFNTWESLIDPDDYERFSRLLIDHLKGKTEKFDGEFRMITKSGDRLWILVRGRIVDWDMNGKPSRMVGTHTDITLRKKDEEKISYQKSLLDSVINNIPDLIFYKTVKGEYFGHNKSFENFVGKNSKQIIGKTDFDLFPGEMAKFFQENDDEMVKRKMTYRHKDWVKIPEGKQVLLETIKTPFYNSAGEILGLLGVSRDLTENMKNLEALKSSEDRYRGLIQSQNDLVIRISSDMKITFANDAYCKKFNLEADHILGADYKTLASKEDSKFLTKSIAGLDKPPYRVRLEQNTKLNGLESCIMWDFYAIQDLYGNTVEIQGVGRDINDIKQTEERLKQTNTELKKLHDNLERKVTDAVKELRERDHMLIKQSRQAAMGEMIGNIAHQWRQPINSLGLIVQNFKNAYEMGIMTSDYLDNKVTKITELINFMSETIDDFRNFFQPNNEKITFSLKETVEKTINFLAHNFVHNNIKVENEIKEDVLIEGFPNEFSQVILNILVNAKDAFLEKKIKEPRIKITLKQHKSKTVVLISDNGGGVPDGIIHHIFEPYFTTKEQGKGTGLGLYMSKAIIEKNMGGRLSVANSDIGAEFRIEI